MPRNFAAFILVRNFQLEARDKRLEKVLSIKRAADRKPGEIAVILSNADITIYQIAQKFAA